MCEWLKQTVLKTVIPERVSGVRIPLPPPDSIQFRELFSDSSRDSRIPGLLSLGQPRDVHRITRRTRCRSFLYAADRQSFSAGKSLEIDQQAKTRRKISLPLGSCRIWLLHKERGLLPNGRDSPRRLVDSGVEIAWRYCS
jgi:hypothetical protein